MSLYTVVMTISGSLPAPTLKFSNIIKFLLNDVKLKAFSSYGLLHVKEAFTAKQTSLKVIKPNPKLLQEKYSINLSDM